MTRYIQLLSMGSLALLLGACETDVVDTAAGANDQALSAQETGAQEGMRGRGKRGPIPQAIEACANLEDGASCTFESPRGTIEGTCLNHPRVDGLSCVPDGRFGKGPGKGFGRGPGPGRGGPPPQAVEACANLEVGADCSFEGFRGNMSGTCAEHPRRGVVACAPEGHFGHGFRHGAGAEQQ